MLSLLGSKLGIAGIGVVLFIALLGWHKIQVGYLEHKIVGLESDVIDEENKNKVCEFNLSDVRTSLSKQSSLVEQARVEADQRVAKAEELAISKFTPPDKVDRMVGVSGLKEMNLFLIDLYGRYFE